MLIPVPSALSWDHEHLSIGPIPTLHVLSVSVTQVTTQEYFVTILVMLQANSGVVFGVWFFFCRSATSGPNLLKKKVLRLQICRTPAWACCLPC